MDKYFIGIMTGTSADSLDGCVVSFDKKFKLITSTSIDHRDGYKENYELCTAAGFKTIEESEILLKLEDDLNNKTLELIQKLLKKSELNAHDISAIGFSGQTVFHTNERSYQIGSPQQISNNSKIKVISDFRNFDIYNGGMGAPLIPAFHKYLYSEKGKRKIIFNIGGIANGTYLDGEDISLASDVGPGNCLMDYISNKKLNFHFDKNGESAKSGSLSQSFLDKLLEKSNKMEYPRSDDKNDYYSFIDESFFEMNANDSLNTLAHFTAQKIKDFYDFCDKPEEIIFHGGGTKNLFLMKLIKESIGKGIKTTDEEIPSKFVESAGFAYLAYLKRGEAFNAK